jgi:poly(U)-specific endoribonuclease
MPRTGHASRRPVAVLPSRNFITTFAKIMKFFPSPDAAIAIALFLACLPTPLLGQDSARLDSEPDIFSRIWDLPEAHVRVTKLGNDGKPLDPTAVVIVNEQGKAGQCLHEDNAPLPLIQVIDESIFKEKTFATLIPLFDNYTAVERRPEVMPADENHTHWKEVDAFLDAVFESKAMKLAVEHIQTEISPGISEQKIRTDVWKMWFEPYSNRYRATTEFCVGFEHVFIGEDESNPGPNDPCTDSVAGYHSWVKFYLEQKQNKTDSLGYDYPGGNVTDALAEPRVTTIVMRWSPTVAEDRSHGNHLLKKPGGFFVGTKPEVEIAFGTLAMYMQLANKYDNVLNKENHRRVRLGKNYFDIVMHPQTLAPAQRGQPAKRGTHIRTLYPKFRGQTIAPDKRADSRFPKIDLPTQPHNNAAIQIISAKPNPEGREDTGEWVKIKNVSQTADFDLSEWSLADKTGRRIKLAGTLRVGESITVSLSRDGNQSMMLANKSGWILLFQGNIRRAAVKYTKAASDATIYFDK